MNIMRTVATVILLLLLSPLAHAQYYDEETGFHQNGYRDYDPSTGRYLEPDPIGLDGGMNLYGYADENPVMGTDRNGLSSTMVLPGPVPLPLPIVVNPVTPGQAQQMASDLKNLAKLLDPRPLATAINSLVKDGNVIIGPWPGSGISTTDVCENDQADADDNRGFCISMYTACQNEGWTGNCQACMDRCTGSGNGNWPFRGPGGCHPRRK